MFILGVPLDPGIQKAKRKAFIERAFVYMAVGMGFGGGSRFQT